MFPMVVDEFEPADWPVPQVAPEPDPAERAAGDPLAELANDLRLLDRAYADIIARIDRLLADRTAPHHAGIGLEQLLSLQGRASGGDARLLVRVARTLRQLPRLAAAFDQGLLSWGQVRALCTMAARLQAEQRAGFDTWLTAQARRLADADPDELIEHAAAEVDRLRADLARDRAARTAEDAFVAVTAFPDGPGGSLYAEYDDVGLATVTTALDAAADPPTAASDDDGHPLPAAFQPSRGQQRAEALLRICQAYLQGHTGDPDCSGARPLLLGLVDSTRPGSAQVWAAINGGRRRITQVAAEQLACDPTWVPILTAAERVLAIGDASTPVSRPLRRAVRARDGGCRFPGCTAPPQWTDAHHVTWRRHHGPTEAENLVSLCRRCHTRVHQRGWRLDYDPHSGIVTVTKGRRSYRSHPRAP